MILDKDIYVGRYSSVARGDIRDLGLGLTAALEDGDTITAATITVTPLADDDPDPISAKTVDPTTGVSYTFTAPDASDEYGITAVFTLADGERITKTATIRVY